MRHLGSESVESTWYIPKSNQNQQVNTSAFLPLSGIVITETLIQSPQQRPDATEGREDQLVNITVAIEHDPDLGTSTGTEMYPWMVTVFYNGQSDCLGDVFGDRVPAGIVDHQMLVDNRQLVFENLEVQLNLTQLICPETVGALQFFQILYHFYCIPGTNASSQSKRHWQNHL